MSELVITHTQIYTVKGLSKEDMDLIRCALIKHSGDLEQPKLDCASTLIRAINYVLPIEE